MLKIINNLSPFFEDCYRRIGVREYSRLKGVTPPTASKLLKGYFKKGILKKEEDKRHILFYANKEDKIFVQLSRIYWTEILKPLKDYLDKTLFLPTIVLFGSLSKAEVKKNSDIDLAIFSKKKNLSLESFEKDFGRNLQIFWFKSISDIKSKELKNSILNGHLLGGRINL